MDDPNMHAYGDDGPTDADIGRQWRENSSLEKWFPLTAERLARLEAENAALKHDLQYARDGLTNGRTRMREDNERLSREAHTWSKAAETYAAELERHKPLMQAVEWILEDGHMSQEHLARLRAAWEGAQRRVNRQPEARSAVGCPVEGRVRRVPVLRADVEGLQT